MIPTHGLVDFHCHLDLYPDHEAAVRECEEAGVFTLTVTTTPKAWPRNHELASRTKHVRAALGLHPQLVADRACELALWETHLPETRYVGEVGLDASPRYFHSFDQQRTVFEHVLRCCAKAGNKVLTVHSVRAVRIVLDCIEANLPATRGQVVLHWFTGSKAELRRAIEMGCYFSINAAMFATERHVALISAVPRDRVLTETDGPFTTTGGRPAKPTDVSTVVGSLANLYSLEPVECAAIVRRNFRTLLGGTSELPT
jgi:TatD DNase family protein